MFPFLGDDNNQTKAIYSNKIHLTAAIADIIISEFLYLNIFQKPIFKMVFNLDFWGYNPPNIQLVYKYLLDAIHAQSMQRNLSTIQKEADIFGFYF